MANAINDPEIENIHTSIVKMVSFNTYTATERIAKIRIIEKLCLH